MSRVYEHRPLGAPHGSTAPMPMPMGSPNVVSGDRSGPSLPPIMSTQNGIALGTPQQGSGGGAALSSLSTTASSAALSSSQIPPGSIIGQQQQPPPPPSVMHNNNNDARGPPPGLAQGPPHPHAARLNDLLEFVKAEFEQVTGESTSLRQQREEYEQIIGHHSNELNAMRAMSYDLERKHHEDKRALQEENSRLQDEVVRLRQQLDQTRVSGASTQGPSTPGSHPRPTLPPISSATSVRPASSQAPQPPSLGHGLPHLYGDHSRVDDVGSSSKRSRQDEEQQQDRHGGILHHKSKQQTAAYPGSRPSSTGPGSTTSRPSPLPSNGALPSMTTPSRDHAGSPAINNSSSTTTTAATTTAMTSAATSATDRPEEKMGEAFDPETVTRDLKKEGSDWMTMFNPNVKRVLDVGLVHTLVHESFSPDGKTLATGCNRNTTLYDTKTGAKITTLIDETSGLKQDNYIRSASFSPDGKLLATGSEDRVIRIWNISQKRISKVFQGHKSEIYSLAFSPDGKRLLSGSGDRTAKVWDMDTGNCLFTLVIEDVTVADNGPIDAGVTSVVMSPDGTLLAAGSLDTFVRIWDAKTGQLLDKLKGHKDSVYSVAFAPDGNFLVSGSLDKTLKMWDIPHLQRELKEKPDVGVGEGNRTPCLTTLQGHKDYVLSVDISPDGAWIVSGSKDRGVQFWDPRTAKAQFMLQGHKNSGKFTNFSTFISVAVSAHGGLVATGSGDWSARIWNYERLD
ncbi:general transcription repressor [Microbotryomycetes sp. JL221]|nr:general transcription repressor [Microbotryomycetes sp. JL221]